MEGTSNAYLAGEWRRISGPGTMLEDPRTGSSRGVLANVDQDVVQGAVVAARAAFDSGWKEAKLQDRRLYLSRLIASVEKRAEAFAECIAQEIGAPFETARSAQVGAALEHLRSTEAALADLVEDGPLTSDPLHRVRYEPLGVAALITPWNWPLNQVVLKVGAALASGCTAVLKPSELSTSTAELLAEAIDEAALPAGVFNMIPGDGTVGDQLIGNPDVDIVSFTGSTEVGRRIASTVGARLGRTTLELGGKSANVLFADCDLSLAVRQGVAHCFRNAGQSCNAASRMLVERPIYEEAVRLAVSEAERYRTGSDDGSVGIVMGPVSSRTQFDRIQSYISTAISEGARCVSGGAGRPVGKTRGYYVRPTVFADVSPDSELFRAEVFGPVLAMTPFDTEDEAVRLANCTGFGLAGYIQTACPVRADRVARQLKVGMVQVNGSSRESGAPFGGRGNSGWGREAGLWGVRAFQDIKSISGTRLLQDQRQT